MSNSSNTASNVVLRRPECAAWMKQGNDITQQFLSFGRRRISITLCIDIPTRNFRSWHS